MVSRSKESVVLPEQRVCGQRAGLGFRRYASCNGRQRSTWCIERLQVFLNRSTSLLLCWLVVSKRQASQYRRFRRSMRSAISDALLRVRSGTLRPVERRLRYAGSRRIAVGLKPLGCTSNDW